MKWEFSFHPFSRHDPSHGEHLPGTASTPGNHDTGKDLGSFLLPFQDLGMYVNRIAYIKFRHVLLETALFDGV
jgi:hypothetical protein